MRSLKPWVQRPFMLVAASSALMASLGNAALWRQLQALGLLGTPSGWALAVGLAVIMGGAVFALASLLAWRWTLKPVLGGLLLTTAVAAYFMLSYGIVVDSSMITNVLQTDRHEARALLSPRLLLVLALGGVMIAAVWTWPLQWTSWGRQAGRNLGAAGLGLLVAVLAALTVFQPLSSAMRNHKQLRYLMNPLSSVWAAGLVLSEPLRRQDNTLHPLGRDAQLAAAHAKPPLLLLVVGETARADRFSINGYGRNTTPELAALDVVSFRQARSCGTSTAVSLPCMFSHLGREAFNDGRTRHENLLDVLQHAGLAVLWVDNQSGCKGVCERVPTVNVSEGPHPELCPGGECHDAMLLEGLDKRLAQLPAAKRARGVVIVLHMMGSHGPAYAARSPLDAKRFLPECTGVNLQECSPQGLQNAYDNSIAYTDRVLAQAVGWLKAQDQHATAMLYVSDHGESLGENNLYLHGLPYAIAPDVQKHVPWITWLSRGFAEARSLRRDCLRERADLPITHDHLLHSVLGLMQVRTQAYRPHLDAYAACMGQGAAAARASQGD